MESNLTRPSRSSIQNQIQYPVPDPAIQYGNRTPTRSDHIRDGIRTHSIPVSNQRQPSWDRTRDILAGIEPETSEMGFEPEGADHIQIRLSSLRCYPDPISTDHKVQTRAIQIQSQRSQVRFHPKCNKRKCSESGPSGFDWI